MNDRELLELAAKAAGLEYEWNACAGAIQYLPHGSRHYKKWNPLSDDADTLRLACRLSADIFINQATVRVEIGRNVVVEDISGGDKPAATRRAIVRAAAVLAIARA